MKLPMVLIATLAAVTLAAQPPGPAQDSSGRPRARAHRSTMLQRLAVRLDLTPNQQSKARAIFQDSRQQSKSLFPQLHQERAALSAAIKANSEQQIDQITQQESQLHAQAAAIRLKAMARVYAILTPEQKAKFDARTNRNAKRPG